MACKRPVPEPRDNRAGVLWSRFGARYSRGTVSSAPKHNRRSGAWRKYGSSAIWHSASSSNAARITVHIGIGLEIAIEEMIQISPGVAAQE